MHTEIFGFLLAKEPNLHKVGLIIDFLLTVSFLFSFLFFDVFERGLYCYGFSPCKIAHLQFPLEIITGSLQLLSLMAFCSYPYNLIFTAEPTRMNMGTCRGRLWFCVNEKRLRAIIRFSLPMVFSIPQSI